MNTVEALKELYKSFGGKLTDTYSDIADGIPVGNYSVIPDCFAALAEIAGGSIELPAVTVSDDGSVLSVVNGAWAKGSKLERRQNESWALDANGSIELTSDLNKMVVGVIVTVGSTNRPTDLNYKVSYKQDSSTTPYYPIVTILDGNTPCASQTVIVNVILMS